MVRFALLILLAAPAAWAAAKVLMDDTSVKVIHATNEPGAKSRLHRHAVNRIMIHLDPGTMRLAFEDGKVNDVVFKPGDVRWDPSGGMHTSENIGGTTYNIIEIELKNPGGAAQASGAKDVLKTSAEHYKVEFENDQVRVLRLRLDARKKTAVHEHVLPRVTVYLNDQHVRMVLPNGRGSTFRYKAGEVSKGGHAHHAEQNLGADPIETIMVELKGRP